MGFRFEISAGLSRVHHSHCHSYFELYQIHVLIVLVMMLFFLFLGEWGWGGVDRTLQLRSQRDQSKTPMPQKGSRPVNPKPEP